MLVPFKWLAEFVDPMPDVEAVDSTLTMLGLEVEGSERHGDDHVLDVNVTPNRPDCLSIIGIARELAAATGAALRLPPHEVQGSRPTAFRVEIMEPELCPRYAGRVVRGVKVGTAPEWMRARLDKCGIRSINSIVDITNYVLLELGHPLHAFDLGTLRGSSIRVGAAGAGRGIRTLDGVERPLPKEALLIMDAERPVAVAGVMGGAETEVSAATVDIFIESAYFRPGSVRRISRAMGLKTEASYRFERGVDREGVVRALDRATSLVLEIAGGQAEDMVDVHPGRQKPAPIAVREEKVNRMLGASMGRGEMIGVLRRLGLEAEPSPEGFTVTPPTYRPDLAMDADIMEEIARLVGYGSIEARLPVSEVRPAEPNARRAFVGRVKEMMLKSGYSEAVSYSFMSPDALDLLGIAPGDPRRRAVEIRNPLRKEESLLRTTLAPALLEMLTRNIFRGVKELRLFEVARVFERAAETLEALPAERLRLGGVYASLRPRVLWPERTEAFFLIKGVVESVLEGLGVTDHVFIRSSEPFLHPGKSADLVVGGGPAGWLGVLSPEVAGRLDLKSRPDVVVFELDLDALMAHFMAGAGASAYSAIPRFPHIERDLALVLDEGVMASHVLGLIRSYPAEIIEDASVFDVFSGGSIPKGKKSMAFGIRYRSRKRTLTDEEVEHVHGSIVAHLIDKTGAEIRT